MEVTRAASNSDHLRCGKYRIFSNLIRTLFTVPEG